MHVKVFRDLCIDVILKNIFLKRINGWIEKCPDGYVLKTSIRDFSGGPVVKTLRAPNAGGTGSIPGRGTKIPHAARRSQKKKKKPSILITLMVEFR